MPKAIQNALSHPRTSLIGGLTLLMGVIAVVLDVLHGIGVQAALQAHWLDLSIGIGLLTAADSAQVAPALEAHPAEAKP